MCWPDLSGNTWTIKTEAREKGNAGILELPPLAYALIAKQLRMNSDTRVFPFRETVLDEASAEVSNGDGWTVHDLRRTARSLMSRAGVSSEHAERVLGHVVGGVEGIYNRHEYANEKAAALSKLAAQVQKIVA
jgi:integrase